MRKKKKAVKPGKEATRQDDSRSGRQEGWSGRFLDLADRAIALDEKKKKKKDGNNAA